MAKDNSLGIMHDCTHLRKLILENPELPIAVMVHQDACSEDYAYTFCCDVSASVGEFLDYELPFGDGYIFSDRDDFREDLQMYLEDFEEYKELTDSQFDTLIDSEMAKYEQYWKKAIIVRAGN